MSERRFRRAAAALALCGLCAWFAPAQAAPLTVAVSRAPLSLPLYITEAEGWLGDGTRLVDCEGGPQCMKLMFDGTADLATASDSALMFSSFERQDFVVLGTFVTSSSNAKLVARKDAGIAQAAHLAGKRVGVVRGASSQFFLDSYLLLHGVDPHALRQVDLKPAQLASALAAGEVDAISAWEPRAFAAVQALGRNAVVLPHAGVYAVSFNLVAPRRLAGPRDDDLARLLGAVQRAEELIARDPARAQSILRARLGVDQRFVEWVWPGLEYRLGLDSSLVKTLEGEARWALREGYVRGAGVPNYLRFIHAAPLARANPAAVGVAP